MKYITLGKECSVATALRGLNLREYALPFDWIISTPQIISNVVMNDFKDFHCSLKLSTDKTSIVDSYGIEYTHDYPTIKEDFFINDNSDIVRERNIIKEGWETHIDDVQDKYRRRIQRFNIIMNSDEPVIALYNGEISGINIFKELFLKKYNKKNIYYVVYSEYDDISNEKKIELLENESISVCNLPDILVDENDNMYIDLNPLSKCYLWADAINKIHLKI
jgi:hypothetical protein